MGKHALIIINPTSGQRRANKYLTDIVTIFCEYICEVRVTHERGDAARFAQETDAELIVCIGGDGTLNEVVSGVIHSNKNTLLGYIPAGSTNDFATGLGLSKDICKAARDIVCGSPIPIDAGRFNERYFSYVASFGAFSSTSYTTSQSAKNTWGHFAYLLEGIRDISNIQPIHMRIDSGDYVYADDDYVFGAISNTTTIGGLLTLDNSLVDFNDGKFEVTLIRNINSANNLAKVLASLQTGDFDPDVIDTFTVSRATFATDYTIPWTLDGERYENSCVFEVENLHSAFNLIINRGNYLK